MSGAAVSHTGGCSIYTGPVLLELTNAEADEKLYTDYKESSKSTETSANLKQPLRESQCGLELIKNFIKMTNSGAQMKLSLR